VVGRHEAPARPAENRRLYTLQRFYHVEPETVAVGERAARFEDAAVDLPVKVFDEWP
jgi:hypothetical protein